MNNKILTKSCVEGYVGKVRSLSDYCDSVYLVAKGNFDGKVDVETLEGITLACMKRDDALFKSEEECRTACEKKKREILEIMKIRVVSQIETI